MSAEYRLSPRVVLHQGDAVKVAGLRGLFRFIEIYDEDYASVIGPVGRAGEGMRVVDARRLRSAGRTTREAVAMSPLARDVSNRAQAWRRPPC